MPRAPVRATTIRSEPVEEGMAKKKTRRVKNATQRSVLDIPADMTPDGVALCWVADSVLGQPSPASRNAFEVNAWEPVTTDMWNGLFDGMWTRKGYVGEINYEGLVLMWRPKELEDEARAEQEDARNNQLRAQQNMVTSGALLQNLPSGFDPTHRTVNNALRRSVHAPMDIPQD